MSSSQNQPAKLPDSGLTELEFVKWKTDVERFIQQFPENRPFLRCGMYSIWTFEEGEARISEIDPFDRPDWWPFFCHSVGLFD